MKKRTIAIIIALVSLVQMFVPSLAWAREYEPPEKENGLVSVGVLDINSYPKLDTKAILEIQKQARNDKKVFDNSNGFRLFGVDSPYLPGQNPSDKEKAVAYANVKVKFSAEGLEENGVQKEFQWNDIFGLDSNGNAGRAKIIFKQKDAETNQEINRFILEISKSGEYNWTDQYMKPAKLPLYSADLKPFRYEVALDYQTSDKITFLTMEIGKSETKSSFKKDNDGNIVADIPLSIKLGQVASTKFTTEWKTSVEENNRPQVEGLFDHDASDGDIDLGDGKTLFESGYFKFPKNNVGQTILRNDSKPIDQYNGFDEFYGNQLRKVPIVKVVEGFDVDTNQPTYTLDETNKIITTLDGKKFKYEFKYNVIDGGKLTMTEIIPVVFDANGGKFASIADASAEQKIVKEVEYGKDLNETIETPTKARESFKGWGVKDETSGNITPINEDELKNITEAKTFYAIWSENEIKVKETKFFELYKNDQGNYVGKPNIDLMAMRDLLEHSLYYVDAMGNEQKYDLPKSYSLRYVPQDMKEPIDKNISSQERAKGQNQFFDLMNEDIRNNFTEPYRFVEWRFQISKERGEPNEYLPQIVKAKIKVYKNIYKGLTNGDKPSYVPGVLNYVKDDASNGIPKDFVKVTVVPTNLAENNQIKYYYVNPRAKVKIPELDPVGIGDNKFVGWTEKADDAAADVDPTPIKINDNGKKVRNNFKKNTTITAQYVSDVIPQEGPKKPDHVPNDFVQVTFVPTDNGTLEGASIFWVNPEKEVTIPVANPVGKEHFTFEEWKLGVNANGDVYNPAVKKQFIDQKTTITATYTEAADIIPYDPVLNPIARPEGYARVIFDADEGLNLTEDKAYFVKISAKKTLNDIKNAQDYGYPEYEEETGFKFKNWSPENNMEIDSDLVIVAKSEKLDNVIPEKDNEQKPNTKPEGYLEVTFVIKTDDQSKGSITGVSKFYVNPTEYVKINPPATVANTGYEFGAWGKDTTIPTVYDTDTTITGSFNQIKAVIPKTKDDESEKPAGYKTVTFVIEGNGGKINDGETKAYYVDPNREVTLTAPKTTAQTGYEFNAWEPNPATSTKYLEDKFIKGSFKKLDDIIPKVGDNGKENPKPEGYVTVTFLPGDNGTISGKTVYYVNPTANKTLKDIIKPTVKLTVKPNVGYKINEQNPWDKTYETEIKSDLTVTAQYTALADVIPKINPNGGENTKPEDYVTVTFKAEDGANGTVTETVYYVNPNKYVKLNPPTDTKGNVGYVFGSWSQDVSNYLKFEKDTIITASFNQIGSVVPKENDQTKKPDGYKTVTFVIEGDGGAIKTGETSVYYVDPNRKVSLTPPETAAQAGYIFDSWDQDATLEKAYTEDTTIKGKFKALDDIIPGDQYKPNGYLEVKFVADNNGNLSGTTLYYVNPTKEVDLTDKANAIVKNPNVGYTEVNGTWDKDITSKEYKKNETYTFNFKELPNVIPAGDGVTQPKGYVKVDFIAGPNGKLEGGNKTYYVNPDKNVKIVETASGNTSSEVVIPTPKADDNYEFEKWSPNINTTDSITASVIYEARFKATKVKITYVVKDEDKSSVTGDLPDSTSYLVGTEITLAGGRNLKKNNYVLKGWKIGDTTYKPGDKFTINADTTATAVWEEDFHTVEFNTDGGNHITAQRVKHGGTITPVDNPIKEGFTFTDWKVNGKDFNPTNDKVTEDITLVAQYVPNVIEQEGKDKPSNVPTEYISVTVDTTDNATDATKFKKIFWVAPDKDVTIPVANPTGKKVDRTDTEAEYTWVFDGWKVTTPAEDPAGTWDSVIKGRFGEATTITAQYKKDDAKAGDIIVGRYSTTESIKDNDGKFINNYLPTEAKLKALVKVVDASGSPHELGLDDKIDLILGKNAEGEAYTSLEDELYDKLKEKNDKLDVRTETINAKVTFANGTSKEVDIPIKVYKNIYEGLTGYGKPLEVTNAEEAIGDDYIRVALIPTEKATNQQIKVFYVRKNAAVVIPGQDPTGRDNYTFIGWKADKPANQINARMLRSLNTESNDANPPVVEDNDNVQINKRHRFDQNTNIEAQYEEEYKPSPDPKPDTPGYNPGGVYYPSPIVKTVEKKVEVDKSKKRLELRYMQGNEGMFMPYKSLTRAEAAQILANALIADGYNYKDIDPNIYYSDLKKDAWYLKAVSIVTQAGVFQGYDGKFMPDRDITQGEWIATLVRFQMQGAMVGNNMNIKDKHWAIPEVQSAYMVGWLKIYTDGAMNFSVDKAITREEVAAVTNRAFNRVRDFEYTLSNDESLYNFKDINRDMWSYNEILCAANSFVHNTENYLAHEIEQRKYSKDYRYEDLIQDYFQRVLRNNN